LLEFGAIYVLLRLLVYVPSRLERQFLPVGFLNPLPVTIDNNGLWPIDNSDDLWPFFSRACDGEFRRALSHGPTVTTVPLEAVAQGKHIDGGDVRRLAGRPRAFQVL
jgi:hypothetical protein